MIEELWQKVSSGATKMVGCDRWKSCQGWCQWDYVRFCSSRKDRNVDGVVQEIQDL